MKATGQCLDEKAALAFLEGKIPLELGPIVDRHLEHCVSCRKLLEAVAILRASEGEDAGSSEPPFPASIERYVVLGEHARGGQARVMLAIDQNIGRKVALKELLPAVGDRGNDRARDEAMARFRREAEITGQLAHPGVVPVFEVGRRPDGTPFYTMQMVRGRTLSEVVRERRGLSDRLTLLNHFLNVCHVVAYAHSRGVLHRDLKPQNIMVGEFGETLLLDWGLAKQKGEPESGPLQISPGSDADAATREGTVVGTPGYMSPEQASGAIAEIDERSDIYGLGAVLFEMLAGKPPPTMAGVRPPPRVHALCPEIPPELACVAEKALAPKKRDRYQRAAELAKEITAFMTGGRVAAYSYSPGDRLRRFAARHRIILGAASVTFIAVVAALVLTFVSWRSERASRQAASQRGHEALQEGAELALVQGDVLQARAKLRGALELEDSLTARALWGRLRSNPERLTASIGALPDSLAFSPDGRELAIGLENATIQVFDAVTRATRLLRGCDGHIYSLAYSSDGAQFAAGTSSGRVAVWDRQSGDFFQLGDKGPPIKALAFDRGSSLLYSADGTGRVMEWDLQERAARPIFQLLLEKAVLMAFSPDVRHLAATTEQGKVILSTLKAGGPGLVLSGAAKPLAFSADGEVLLGGGLDGKVYLWRARDGVLERTLSGHQAWISKIATSPDGRFIASSSADAAIRIWNLRDARLERVLSVDGEMARVLAFDPSGTLLAAGANERLRVWDHHLAGSQEKPLPPSQSQSRARFSPDGKHIASVGIDGAVRLWESASGELLATWPVRERRLLDLCFSPDGKLLASVGHDGVLIIQEAETGLVRHRLAYGDSSWAIACSPDRRHIASGGYDSNIRIWDAASGELVKILRLPEAASGLVHRAVEALIYTEDGRRLIAGRQNGSLELWEIASSRIVRQFTGHGLDVLGLALDPGERLLASASSDRSVRLWTLAEGSSRVLGETEGRAYRLSWDRLGQRLAIPTSTGEIHVWTPDGAQRSSFQAHHEEANSIEFSPDGKTAVSAGDDATVRLWDAETWQPMWRTRAMVWAPELQLLTHRGWHAIPRGSELEPLAPAPSAWRHAVEAAPESLSEPAGPICVESGLGVEIWDAASDRPLLFEPLPPPFDIAALPGGCSVLKGGRATLFRAGHPALELATRVRFQNGGKTLAAVGSEVSFFDPQGRSLGHYGSGANVTAAALLGEVAVIGFADGGIELRSRTSRAKVFFQDTPASAVTRLAGAPSGALAAGFSDGTFGVWSMSSGARIEHGAVHGAVRHLEYDSPRLVVASELGSLASMDLSALTADYCDLLSEVWSRVPVLWHDQGAVIDRPEVTHRCMAGREVPASKKVAGRAARR